MSAEIVSWLTGLLDRGVSVQTRPPEPGTFATPEVVARLREAFERHALAVAGPPLPFAPEVSVEAAGVVASACWRLVCDPDESARPVRMGTPRTAADHLSADMLLRFLPAAYRRAVARADAGLVGELEAVLCRWPLSGVLAEPDATPAPALDFFGHPGLQLLYAERLGDAPRPSWVPPFGPAREWAERVFAARGRSLPAPPEPAA